jgi:hypothetical protein
LEVRKFYSKITNPAIEAEQNSLGRLVSDDILSHVKIFGGGNFNNYTNSSVYLTSTKPAGYTGNHYSYTLNSFFTGGYRFMSIEQATLELQAYLHTTAFHYGVFADSISANVDPDDMSSSNPFATLRVAIVDDKNEPVMPKNVEDSAINPAGYREFSHGSFDGRIVATNMPGSANLYTMAFSKELRDHTQSPYGYYMNPLDFQLLTYRNISISQGQLSRFSFLQYGQVDDLFVHEEVGN